jgi:hypothetical protein
LTARLDESPEQKAGSPTDVKPMADSRVDSPPAG